MATENFKKLCVENFVRYQPPDKLNDLQIALTCSDDKIKVFKLSGKIFKYMFEKITGFNVAGVPQPFIDERFQYFHHYWSIINYSNRNIFFDEIWFESHRSIIIKIEQQFQYNKDEDSYKWFKYLFLDHPFFQNTNIIATQNPILRNINKIHKYIYLTGGASEKQKKSNYIIYIDEIKKCIRRIRFILFEKQDYTKTLSITLTNILSENLPLNERTKENIRFLVTSFIVELYSYGYNLEYIKKIPNIIMSRDNMNEFPFEKTIEDFDDDIEKYTFYKAEERKDFTIEKCFSGLVNLVNRPLKDGYYIFKIENFILQDPHPIIIGDVTFYNPQKNSMLNLSTTKDEWKQRYLEAELFYSPRSDEDIDKTKRSNCNAIIKSKIKSHNNIESPSELFQAFHIVSKSLEILKDMVSNSGIRDTGNPFIHFHRHFKLHSNKKMANFNFRILNEGIMMVNLSDSDRNDAFDAKVSFINRININTEIGSKLFHIISMQSKIKNSDHFFTFKDIWIAWEALIDRRKMKEIAKDIYYIRYKKHYMLMIFRFLNLNLSNGNMFFSPEYWTLDNKDLKKIGLHYDETEKQHKRKFLKKYNSIFPAVPIEIVNDIIRKIDEYIVNESAFFDRLNKWIDNTIDEVYIERNMEVHKNLHNDLSAVKLKEDFLRISGALYHEIIDFSDKRNPNNFQLVMDRIHAYKNRL